MDALELAKTAAAALLDRFQLDRLDVGLILGSGWSSAIEGVGEVVGEAPLGELPGFTKPVVAGHGGVARALRTGSGRTAVVFTGRTHFYEGRGVGPVAHGVRTIAAAGASRVVITNGCGGLNPARA